MTTNDLLINKREEAKQKVNRFVNRFEKSYEWLACHAALPLVLTPELLNYLRIQFLKGQVPWVAEVDLLLSELCRPVGYELYVMDTEVRTYLLHKLEQQFGKQRMEGVARRLISYVRYLAKNNPFIGEKEREAQQWAAMVYLDKDKVVKEIKKSLENCVDKAEWARLSRITEELNLPSTDSQILRDCARVVSNSWTKKETDQKVIQEISFEAEVATIVFEEGTNQDEEKLQQWEFQTLTVNRRGEEIKREIHSAQYFTETLTDSVGLEMVAIPGGIFTMGSPENEGSNDERPQHQVTVSPFFMGKYPVTQAQWKAIASRTDLKVKIDLDPEPSRFKGDNRPVEKVNWYEAVEFCQRLSKLTRREYRLPSEAEWEYACRAVTSVRSSAKSKESIQNPKSKIQNRTYPPFYFGDTITSNLANYNASYTYADEPKGEKSKGTTPVGQFPPNAFGLYDMHGQVWEWCADDWHNNYENAPTDGSAWIDDNEGDNANNENESYSAKNNENESYTVLRGGSWILVPNYCRSAARGFNISRDDRDLNNGFRVVCGFGRTL